MRAGVCEGEGPDRGTAGFPADGFCGRSPAREVEFLKGDTLYSKFPGCGERRLRYPKLGPGGVRMPGRVPGGGICTRYTDKWQEICHRGTVRGRCLMKICEVCRFSTKFA